jgi:MFS superfamily sulfate permease-like transporter
MTKSSAILGVLLLCVCIIAQWFFARYHVDPGNLITTAMGIAVAIIFGFKQVETTTRLAHTEKALVALRDSGRPGALPEPREPSIPPPGGGGSP